MAVTDITGNVYGRWTVLERYDAERWTCRCQCGTTKPIYAYSLKNGDSKSCGCYRKAMAPYILRVHGHSAGSITREYRIWKNMNRRCYTPSAKSYRIYGERGIAVCDAWRRSYQTFLADMGPCPAGRSIDRIDNNGNYEPGNCRWAEKKQQSRNTRQNVRLTLNGRTMTVVEWAEALEISAKCLYSRKKLGWSDHRALTEPVRPY
jgi:hypothetical protein